MMVQLMEAVKLVGGSTALWFEHWPGDRKVPGSMPSSVSYCCCCFLEQGALLSLLQSAQLYKWVNLSHQYCEEFGDLSPKGAVQVWRDLPGEGFTVKNDRICSQYTHKNLESFLLTLAA